MKTVAAALTWEYWRRGAVPFPVTVASMVGVTALVYSILWMIGLDAPLRSEGVVMQNSLIMVATLHAISAPLMVTGSFDRKFTLPAAGWSIVGWPFAWGCLTSAAMYLALAAGVNLWIDPDWPLWGPALLIAATYAIAQTIGWSMRRSPTLMIVGCTAEIALLGFWANAIIDDPMDASWNVPTFFETVVMLAVIGVSYLASVAAFQHARRGGRLDLSAVARVVGEFFEARFATRPSDGRQRTFATPGRALVWREWREKGVFIPLAIAAIYVAMTLWFLTGLPSAGLAVELSIVVSACTFMALPLIGVALGHASPAMSLPTFKATQPVTDASLAGAVLKNVVLTLAVSAAVCIAGITATLAAASIAHFNLEPLKILKSNLANEVEAQRAPWAVAGALAIVGAWTMCANGAWMGIGRRGVFMGIAIVGPALLVAGITFVNWCVPEAARPIVAQILWGLVAATVAVGSAAAFSIAVRRRLVTVSVCGLSLVGWLAVAALVCAQIFWNRPLTATSLVVGFILAGLSALAVTPLAAAPLAMAHNRRR